MKKEGKYLHITNLGKAVTEWMKRYFEDIEDLKFTAGMEQKLDAVETGSVGWKDVLRDFYYDGFEEHLNAAAEGERQPVQPTVSDEICPECGRNLVERDGKFGTFLGCPGYPDCTFTMPLVIEMPGRCPACGGRILKRTSRNGYTYYACENGKECPWRGEGKDGQEIVGFMTWDIPVKDDCPVCGQTMFKKSGKGFKRPYCINEKCSNFTPEEKRGGYQKKAKAAEEKKETAEEKKTAKKTTKSAAKTTAKKTTKKAADGEKKTTAKRSKKAAE